MSAIAARKAALLRQQQSATTSPATSPTPVSSVAETPFPSTSADLPRQSSSSRRKTYSKKDQASIKGGKNSRTAWNGDASKELSQTTASLSEPTQFNNNPIDLDPEDRVFVEIDIVEQQEIPRDTAAPVIQAAYQATVEKHSAESENEVDNSDFAFDFEAAGILASSGRPRKKRRIDTDNHGLAPISNFAPTEGINIQRLAAEDVSRLLPGLPHKKAVVVVLQPEETIVLSGTARIAPIQGSLSLFSTTISPSTETKSYPLYAPLTHPLPTLAAAGPHLPYSQLATVAPCLPSTMLSHCHTESVVFIIQELDSGLNAMPGSAVGLHKVWPEGKAAFGLQGVHPILRQSQSPIYRYSTPESWRGALQSIGESKAPSTETASEVEEMEALEDRSLPLVMIVKGAKRSGKSTFAREAVNRLLQKYERVAYLDTDLGQSEFGVGGSVGLYIVERPLFGPAMTHPMNALRSHFVGSLNPRLSSEHYISCIAQLIEHYRYEVQYPLQVSAGSERISEVVPLVINTQGWVKGLGADLLLDIERLAEPTHTFIFAESAYDGPDDQTGQSYQADDLGADESNMQLRSGFGTVIQLQSIPASPLLSRFTASDMRTISTISYLHARMTENHVFWDFSSPLACHAPWQVNVDTVFREVYMTGEGADGILEDDLELALNGRLIALVERIEGTAEGFYQAGRPLPPANEINCLGVGLIRSISPDRKTIHLLTPLHVSHLSRVSIAIAGEVELPVCGMMDWRIPGSATGKPALSLFGVQWEDVPFLTVGQDQGVGMAKRKWRRNIMRRGQAA